MEALSCGFQFSQWIVMPMMRPHITYMHNEPCATLARHFCDDLGRFTLKDNKGRQTGDALRPFAMSYTILQCSTVLPFTFATFLDFALFNTLPDCVAFSGTFHQTLFTWWVHHSLAFWLLYWSDRPKTKHQWGCLKFALRNNIICQQSLVSEGNNHCLILLFIKQNSIIYNIHN